MKQFEGFKKLKGIGKTYFRPLAKASERGNENILTPVNLPGTVVPWSKALSNGRESDFKLMGPDGPEYFIVADAEWRGILSFYCWEEVQVIGFVNRTNRTLIPQKIFLKGQRGEVESILDLTLEKNRELRKKLIRNLNDLILIPAAVWAMLAF
ncbi:MAG: hypothetical protein ACXWRE_08855 [Pseudobdellovibrionaceae bacterium]